MGRGDTQNQSLPPPNYFRSSNLVAQTAKRGDGGGTAGQAEAAPRSSLLHQGLRRKKGAVCLGLQLTRLRAETGSGALRSEETEEKELVVCEVGGWGRPGPSQHTKSHAKRGGRAALAAVGRGSCLQPGVENRGAFIPAPLHSKKEFDPRCA